MVNIESYIHLTNKKEKKPKSNHIQSIDNLSFDQIGEKLFNRRVGRKKPKEKKTLIKE